ncbi:similar to PENTATRICOPEPTIDE REPEAT 596 [Actinidia rufa]|uniref:Similar to PENTATRICOPEPTIDE REPEAT 596 n=1 Tax=Actinidia rufa TaxID=165716 RepID=A0A7J0EE13_9ERIC|nr:similar to PENTATRICOPEPTIDE REPEAT 596 [Actinidia rufa]
MEGDNIKEHRWACHALLLLYAALRKADEVGRVWKVCESNPKVDECLAAIESWGKLNKVEETKAGKNLVKRMDDSGFRISPFTWDALVKLYVEAGEVEKADSILQKANHQNQMMPIFSSYMAIMDQYAKRGDIHNSEKMLHRMWQAEWVYRERMKADNIFPNKAVAGQLAQVDVFQRMVVSDLLD